MENWIEVLKFTLNAENTCQGFLELLDKEKIPHKEDVKECWKGSAKHPIYEQNIIVYVPKQYKEKVESYLNEYTDPNNIVYEEAEELKNINDEDEEQEREFKKRNIAQKILILIPFIMVSIVILCGIISSIIY